MISNDGSEVSIWISRSVVCLKILSRSPRIGDMANPGRETTAETDQIATSTFRGIVPRPVCIFSITFVAN